MAKPKCPTHRLTSQVVWANGAGPLAAAFVWTESRESGVTLVRFARRHTAALEPSVSIVDHPFRARGLSDLNSVARYEWELIRARTQAGLDSQKCIECHRAAAARLRRAAARRHSMYIFGSQRFVNKCVLGPPKRNALLYVRHTSLVMSTLDLALAPNHADF